MSSSWSTPARATPRRLLRRPAPSPMRWPRPLPGATTPAEGIGSRMATATFLVHPERPDALDLTRDTAEWLAARGHTARILEFAALDRLTEDGVERDITDV